MPAGIAGARLRDLVRRWLRGPRAEGPGGTILASNRYGSYAIPGESLHRPAARVVAGGGVYEPDTIAFIRNRCGPGDVVHAGTFFGDFLPGLMGALRPDAMLWAFEPNPESFEHARRTGAINGLRNLRLENAALSDREGQATLQVRDASGRALGGSSRLLAPGRGAAGEGAISVRSLTIDGAIPADRSVTVIHLDLEGHEKPALLGARRTILANRPILVLEDFDDAAWLREHFPEAGYVPAGFLHRNAVYIAA